MTTSIKVQSHNYPAQVVTLDSGREVSSQVITPEDGEVTLYCTTTRELRIVDLEYEHPAVKAHEENKRATAAKAAPKK